MSDWISVTKKLPSRGQIIDVLVDEGQNFCNLKYACGSFNKPATSGPPNFNWWVDIEALGFKVTHWMPREAKD